MKRFPKNYMVAVFARWSAWLVVLLLLWNNGTFSAVREPRHVLALVFLSYTTIYALLWTRQLRHLATRTNDGSIIILYDLVLSALPMWPTGGWTSPFLPFALSVLVVPTVSRGWRGGSLVAAIFLALDQIMLWTMRPNPWEIATSQHAVSFFGRTVSIDGSAALLGRTLLPFGLVAVVAGLAAFRQHYTRRVERHAQRLPPSVRWEHPTVRSMLADADEPPPTYAGTSRGEPELARTWGHERASQSTLERRSSTSINGALRHFRPELQAVGIALAVEVEGDETSVSEQIHALLTKALEVALDNVLSHAHARSVLVELKFGHEATLLTVCDDGVGLYDGTAEPPGFHQVKRLRFRATELGGELQVIERAEGGVKFALRVPHVL
jgi:hypothetical protein